MNAFTQLALSESDEISNDNIEHTSNFTWLVKKIRWVQEVTQSSGSELCLLEKGIIFNINSSFPFNIKHRSCYIL